MKISIAVFTLVLAATFSWAQGVRLMFTGNVDRIPLQTVQVLNPDPAGAPLTVPIIGVEYHVMDPAPGFYPIDLRIFFPLMTDNSRAIENCVEWFGKTQARELALNINHEPGQWDGTKSPWPYLQVNFPQNVQQIHTYTLDGQEIWLWDGADVQCQQIFDNRAPYWTNDDGTDAVVRRMDVSRLIAKWHLKVEWDGLYAPYRGLTQD